MQMPTAYEVIRAFPGAGSKTLAPGTILNLQDLNPNHIEGLVKRRFLRAMPVGGKSRAEEQADWLAQLAPYESVEGPDATPAGCEMARLQQVSVSAAKQASALEAHAGKLRAQLEKAQAMIDDADEKSDFALVARAQAEVTVIGRLWSDADREALVARRAADDAERASSRAWSSVVSARIVLRRMIETGPIDERDTPRWVRAWGVLRASLDVAPAKQAA